MVKRCGEQVVYFATGAVRLHWMVPRRIEESLQGSRHVVCLQRQRRQAQMYFGLCT